MKDILTENTIIYIVIITLSFMLWNNLQDTYKNFIIKQCIKYNYVDIDGNIFYCSIKYTSNSEIVIEE